jgi:hypothetical protein
MKYQMMLENVIRKEADIVCAKDKGYPEIVTPLTYVTRMSPDNEIMGYTCYSDMGDFYFVGNTYINPNNRGKGIYGDILFHRNRCLHDKPKITLVNPINGTNPEILFAQVEKQGGVRVSFYAMVSHLMSRDLYEKLNVLPMFVYW